MMRNKMPSAADRATTLSQLRLSRQTPGEMALQGVTEYRGSESVPQMLVQLVGFRDPDAGLDRWRRPQAGGIKSPTA
jgi:hypothetical protein